MRRATAATHVIELHEPILLPDDGLVIGNGDLSVAVYQTPHAIIFRFGKNDVWDRRVDLSDDPRPLDIEEMAHGIRVEGWKCGPYGGPVEATHGARDAKRMHEVCQGSPPSYKHRPFPCPKPTGELALHFPPDLPGLHVTQRLHLEDARLEVSCSWDHGVRLEIEAFIPPTPNVLVVRWQVRGWDEHTHIGLGRPPAWFSLYRWADPSVAEFAARLEADHTAAAGFGWLVTPQATPLPLPACATEEGAHFVEQRFPPELTFPAGFSYRLVPLARDLEIIPLALAATGEARLRLWPTATTWFQGALAVNVPTASDPGGTAAEMRRVREAFDQDPAGAFAAWAEANRASAAAFWSRSAVRLDDELLENVWYETLHARRCHYRADHAPPGLYLPSSLRDYMHWHGDYHWNYNIQSPFWGDYTANHVDDLADAYHQAMDYMLRLGRRIAHDYYHCRGVFIQLTGYPVEAPDDWLGIAPMGRMAYMTGWAANHYWWRYCYTQDRGWLAKTGYPVLRECALFYTDFLKLGDDGQYHAFPSNQGEDGFTGDAKDYTDRPQILRHLRYCLRTAIAAAEVLGVDPELQAQWRERLAHVAPDDNQPGPELPGIPRALVARFAPEFYATNGGQSPAADPAAPSPWAAPDFWLRTWYFGQLPWHWMIHLRSGVFVPDRDLPHIRRIIQRWRRPNGLITAMTRGHYGALGAWAEPLGVLGPLQELLLQSWKGHIEVFPAWPHTVSAEFRDLRAEGAFLVGARLAAGVVGEVTIRSERGGRCQVKDPWPEGVTVVGADGQVVAAERADGLTAFATQPGAVYALRPPGEA